MRYRKLRIAWTMVWGFVALLLCVLWARSYWHNELCYWTATNRTHTSLGSNSGVMYFSRNKLEATLTPRDWTYANFPPHETIWSHWCRCDGWNQHIDVGVSHWTIVLSVSILGSLPWLPLRFSLRTMLIATTLVAASLGAAVVLSR